jgi:hypothetical protein
MKSYNCWEKEEKDICKIVGEERREMERSGWESGVTGRIKTLRVGWPV